MTSMANMTTIAKESSVVCPSVSASTRTITVYEATRVGNTFSFRSISAEYNPETNEITIEGVTYSVTENPYRDERGQYSHYAGGYFFDL